MKMLKLKERFYHRGCERKMMCLRETRKRRVRSEEDGRDDGQGILKYLVEEDEMVH